MSALSGFNNVLLKFLDRTIKWYPDLKDMRTIRTGTETLKKYNPRLVLDQFMGYIGRYYIEIFNKKEEFFTELSNLHEDPNISSLDNSDQQQSVMLKMGVFKDIWSEMPEDRKQYIWKMFRALLKVGALGSTDPQYDIILKYVETNPQLFIK